MKRLLFFLFGVFALFIIGLIPKKLTIMAEDNLPPVLSVSSPKNGDHILGSKITLTFVVGNFTFVAPKEKKTNNPREGHLNIWLDKPFPTLSNATKIATNGDYIFPNISPGQHYLKIEVVQNDNSSENPPIIYTASFITTLPFPTASATPKPYLVAQAEKLPKKYIYISAGIILFIIGLISYLRYGRKKFMND